MARSSQPTPRPCAAARRSAPGGADQVTGFSKDLSFEEAFSDALLKLPGVQYPHPDQLERVRVLEIGALFGGIAGFRDLTVTVCRTHD